MDTAAIIARLKAQLTGWVAIGGAADVDQAIETAPATPAAYVVPLAESGAPPDLIGIYRQDLVQAFGVVIVVANLRDATGAAAAADLQARRLAVLAALLGWAPDAATGYPVVFTSGRLLQFRDARLWWTDEFEVSSEYRSA